MKPLKTARNFGLPTCHYLRLLCRCWTAAACVQVSIYGLKTCSTCSQFRLKYSSPSTKHCRLSPNPSNEHPTNMRSAIAALATLAIVIAPIRAQEVLATVLTYENGWVEGDNICLGSALTSVNIDNYDDQTCYPAPNVDCLTGVQLHHSSDCDLIVYTDSACTQEHWYDDLFEDWLSYHHLPGTQAFRVVCKP